MIRALARVAANLLYWPGVIVVLFGLVLCAAAEEIEKW